LPVLGGHFIRVRGDDCVRLDQFVDDIGRFSRSCRINVADVQDGQVRMELLSDHEILIRDHAGVAREIDRKAIRKAQHVTSRRPDVSGQTVGLQLLRDIAAEEGRRDTLVWAAGTLQMETPPSLLIAPKRTVTTCSLSPPTAGILLPNQLFISPPTKNFAFLATMIFSVFELGASLTSNFGWAQSPA